MKSPHARSPVVLLVEDDAGIRRFVRTALESEGCTAHEATALERGRIELASRFYAPTRVGVTLADGQAGRDGRGRLQERVDEWDGRLPGGFQFQAAEVARCLSSGAVESEVMPWSATLEVLDVMDRVRALLGVVYPGEREGRRR